MTAAGAMISLCMIVRDEAERLARCVSSARRYVGEIVIVDTGSTDDTPRIAAALGARVGHFRWQDDFAAARNHSLSLASGDWILVLDADEELRAGDGDLLDALVRDRSSCYQLTQRHYVDDPRVSGFVPASPDDAAAEGHAGYFESALVRLFPRDPRLRYVGRVHELVEPSVAAAPGFRVADSGLLLHHYGHVASGRRMAEKASRYRSLGERKAEESVSDWKAAFELGVELNRGGRAAESKRAFRTAVALNPGYPPAWVNLGYVLCGLGEWDAAEEALAAAARLDPEGEEAYCNLGVVRLRRGDLEGAERSLAAAVKLKPGYANAWYNLGLVYARLGRAAEAAFALGEALAAAPGFADAHADLGAVHLSVGRTAAAVRHLRAAMKDPSAGPRSALNLARAYAAAGRPGRALAFYRRAARYDGPAEISAAAAAESEDVRNRYCS